MQLGHAGAKGSTCVPWDGGEDRPLPLANWPLVAASAQQYLAGVSQTAREATRDDLARIEADFVAATRRDAGSAIAWTSGLIVTSFVLDFLARVWAPVEWMRPLSLFSYFQPADIVQAGLTAPDPAALAVVAIVTTAAAAVVFTRRDL